MDEWTPRRVSDQLRTWTTTGNFWKMLFEWSEEELVEAIERATAAMSRADIRPDENMCFVRLDRTTKKLTAGGLKRLSAEADLLARSHSIDGLFLLPHERDETKPPRWFRREMTYHGRENSIQYDYPTITQKFCEFARDKQKSASGRKTATQNEQKDAASPTSGHPVTALPDTLTKRKRRDAIDNDNMVEPSAESEESKKRKFDTNLGDSNINFTPRSPLDEVEVHVGWLTRRKDDIMILEKSYRSLRTWLESTTPWRYDFAAMKTSLQIPANSGLRVFWFEDHTKSAWEAHGNHAITGAIERMHRKGEICLFVAAAIEHVHALPIERRLIQYQTEQTVSFDLRSMEHPQWDPKVPVNDDDVHNESEYLPLRRPFYEIPNITVSLARILGEVKMRSRVSFEDLGPRSSSSSIGRMSE